MSNTSKRGFASMSEEVKRKIASKGGHAVSANREHMAKIGSKGGTKSGINRRARAAKRKEVIEVVLDEIELTGV